MDFGVNCCVNFLRGFLGWDSSPVDFTVDLSVDFVFTHCVDSLSKVQSWPILVTVDFDVDFHRGFFWIGFTMISARTKFTLFFHTVFRGYPNDPQW